jgi:hypothetical protein
VISELSSMKKKLKAAYRVCSRGHRYLKTPSTSACTVCWPGQAAKKRASDLPTELAAPARRALDAASITSLAQLARGSESEVLELHGMGPSAIRIIRSAMKARGLSFSGR